MLVLMLAQAAALSPDLAIGRWQTESRHGIVEIARCAAGLCGTLVASDGLRSNPDLRDSKNRDPALRQRNLRGLPMLQGFRWQDGAWSGGRLYNPEDGGTYSGTLTILGPDRLRLRGCIVWPLCKSQTWSRVR
ncbi:DUF2147 domain-containing protein [Novosphingobium piscinae]|uniref:DUF2147 domain-containing protein n=1 Tax=Novosphingobium piscinae TaxID=1507448 RepID=A0A7X1FZY5_9SPHN|nr:DUF2147 domain-containing protein [Novosphingobium piscinae]MBC2669954.1 DUF2147 domain-containing protein [Novosphingobium piscinae]